MFACFLLLHPKGSLGGGGRVMELHSAWERNRVERERGGRVQQ